MRLTPIQEVSSTIEHCAKAITSIIKWVSKTICSSASVGAALVQHPKVAIVSFTGSTAVGKTILKMAADAVKPVMTKLGGNDAMIVLAGVTIGNPEQPGVHLESLKFEIGCT